MPQFVSLQSRETENALNKLWVITSFYAFCKILNKFAPTN